MNKIKPLLWLFMLSLALPSQAANRECVDDYLSHDKWDKVKRNITQYKANDLIDELAPCLGSPNSKLRDAYAYEIITYWIRRGQLSNEKLDILQLQLLSKLPVGAGETGGDNSFYRAFSALILSELVRDDTKRRRWSKQQVNILTDQAIKMFVAERDYRGLDKTYGWIHTVAHGSDLLWRLAMHPKVSASQQLQILKSLDKQLVADHVPAYTFNEHDRIARVAYAIIKRRDLSEAQLDQWLRKIASSQNAGVPDWRNAFNSVPGMQKLHNVKHFLRALRNEIPRQNSVLSNRLDNALKSLP